MPFIPHTELEVREMLDAIGARSIDDLFDEIPADLRAELKDVPPGLPEMAVMRLMAARAQQDHCDLCFIGAGAYEHHIPAAVWEITTRGEYYTAYTPYQAEASQGTLQLLYEYQTMMAGLTGLDVSNASLYDGASALAEAVLMAVRANRHSKSKRILMPATVHPHYRQVVHAIVRNQGVELVELAYSRDGGHIDPASLQQYAGEDFAALVIPQPNFFGVLEEVDALTDWAHAQGALVIGVVNPTALALLTPPGAWGTKGADIACGEGQPLGAPLSSGGPYFGFMCCRQEWVRQMPGRIVGRTVDRDGKPGFTLTLQAREQHIRRSKATSNICTNQGLVVTAATIIPRCWAPRVWNESRPPVTPTPCAWRTSSAAWPVSSGYSIGRYFTRPCCACRDRWRKCWRPWPNAASPAASISVKPTRSWVMRCWCAPPKPRARPIWMSTPPCWGLYSAGNVSISSATARS